MACEDSSGEERAMPTLPQGGDLDGILKKLRDMKQGGDMDRYLEEAIGCIRAGSNTAAVVMCWNALVLAIRKKVEELDLGDIQAVLKAIGARTGSSIASISNLAGVSDSNLVKMGEKIGLYDVGVAEKLDSMRNVRNAAAHVSQAMISSSDVHAFIDNMHQFVGMVSGARLMADDSLIERLASLDAQDMDREVRSMPRPLAASCAKKALAEVVAIAARESPRAERLFLIATSCIQARCTDAERLKILHSLST